MASRPRDLPAHPYKGWVLTSVRHITFSYIQSTFKMQSSSSSFLLRVIFCFALFCFTLQFNVSWKFSLNIDKYKLVFNNSTVSCSVKFIIQFLRMQLSKILVARHHQISLFYCKTHFQSKVSDSMRYFVFDGSGIIDYLKTIQLFFFKNFPTNVSDSSMPRLWYHSVFNCHFIENVFFNAQNYIRWNPFV